jgi:hypothetical protein
VGSGYDKTATNDFLFSLGADAVAPVALTTSYQGDYPTAWPNWGGPCLRMGYDGTLGAGGGCDADDYACPDLPDDFCGGDKGTWGETELEVRWGEGPNE